MNKITFISKIPFTCYLARIRKNYVVAWLCVLSFGVFAVTSKHRYVPVPGGKLYYQKIGQGNPIIVIHGGPGLEQTYLLPQMMQLRKTHQVIFYDQRGSGKSLPAHLDIKFINLQQFTQDIEDIRQTLGYKKVILIGHSWGGMLAMNYAMHYPQHTKALILMNSIPATSAGVDAFNKEFEKRIQPIQGQIDIITKSQAFMNGDPAAFQYYCQLLFKKYLYKQSDIQKLSLNFSSETSKNQGKIEAIFNQSLFEKKYDIRSKLKKLKMPTLIIHGEFDPIPLWTAKQIAFSIPNSKLIVIKKSGHFPYAEQAGHVFLAIQHFLDKSVKDSKQ